MNVVSPLRCAVDLIDRLIICELAFVKKVYRRERERYHSDCCVM